MALEHRLTRMATLSLGLLYVAAGITQGATAAATGDGRLTFSFGTLLGGGAVVLVGMALTPRQPHVGRGLVCVGALLGVLVTARTIVVPVLAVAAVVLTLREATSPGPPGGRHPE